MPTEELPRAQRKGGTLLIEGQLLIFTRDSIMGTPGSNLDIVISMRPFSSNFTAKQSTLCSVNEDCCGLCKKTLDVAK
jgi:hypothetical protein